MGIGKRGHNQTEGNASSKLLKSGDRKSLTFMVADERWKPKDKSKPKCFYCPRPHWPDQCDVITDVTRNTSTTSENDCVLNVGRDTW